MVESTGDGRPDPLVLPVVLDYLLLEVLDTVMLVPLEFVDGTELLAAFRTLEQQVLDVVEVLHHLLAVVLVSDHVLE